MRRFVFCLVLCLAASPMSADDGAASIAAGGLVLMKREPRIVMAKEVLRIAPNKIVVDYDFRNDSSEDITTPVAFPVAPYTWDEYEEAHENGFSGVGSKPGDSRIRSFRLQVDGHKVPYQTSVSARLHGVDFAPTLRSMHVDAATFGHIGEGDEGLDDLEKLQFVQKERLIKLGLLSSGGFPSPTWKVELKYYWTQRFAAHQTVHVRHEYIPITGEAQVPPEYLPGRDVHSGSEDMAKDIRKLLASTCMVDRDADSIRKTLNRRPIHDTKDLSTEASIREWFSHLLLLDYVDFILTTANTWKQPIEDFTLIVNTKPYPREPRESVYFCGDGSLIDGSGFTTTYHANNFVPTHELRVGFYRY